MLGELGVGQDLFAELEPVSVLLVFVTSLLKKGKRNHIRAREQEGEFRESDERERESEREHKTHSGVYSVRLTQDNSLHSALLS